MKKSHVKATHVGSQSGFTLTELLVVIAIVAVLAILSIMGLGRIRAAADKANSARNLAQFQTANVSYAADHNGNFVPIRANDEDGKTTRWFQDEAYLANLFGEVLDTSGKQLSTYPLEILDPKVVRARREEYDRVFASYGMNDTTLLLGGEPGLKSFHSMNRMPDPSRSMAFSTAIDFRVTYNARFNWKLKDQIDSRKAPGSVGAMAYRHNDKALVVYFDGHVAEMSQGDIKEIDSNRGKSNPFWTPTAK